jgi:hypothetical protein
VLFALFTPFRRIWTAHWFVPIARIGQHGMDQYPLAGTKLSPNETEITARTSGELFLFVNDAVLPIGVMPPALGWQSYYVNNQGTARGSVCRVEEKSGTCK